MDTKPWYQSLTIWGTTILAFSGLILPLIGKSDIAAIVQEEQAGIIDWLATLGALVGSALALIGRIRAKTSLTS